MELITENRTISELARDNAQLPKITRVDKISYPQTGAEDLGEVEENHFWFTARREVVLNLIQSNLNRGPRH